MAEQEQAGSTEMSIGSIVKTATQAVQQDGQGNLEEAIKLYNTAASQLEKLIELGTGSPSDLEDWKSKVQQYKTRVTYLQQRLQEVKLEQYAQTAKLAQEGMSMAAKGQQAVKVAGGPSPLAGAAAVGAGVGLVLAGPIGALAGAAGIAYAATTKDTGVGEAARKTGQVAVGHEINLDMMQFYKDDKARKKKLKQQSKSSKTSGADAYGTDDEESVRPSGGAMLSVVILIAGSIILGIPLYIYRKQARLDQIGSHSMYPKRHHRTPKSKVRFKE